MRKCQMKITSHAKLFLCFSAFICIYIYVYKLCTHGSKHASQNFSKWKIYKNNSEMGIVKVKKSKVDFEMYSPHIIIDCDDSGLKLIYTII